VTRKSFNLSGSEKIDITGFTTDMKPRMKVQAVIHREDGSQNNVELISRIDTLNEVDYFKAGGILQHVIRSML
jgi:aconitate hydratase